MSGELTEDIVGNGRPGLVGRPASRLHVHVVFGRPARWLVPGSVSNQQGKQDHAARPYIDYVGPIRAHDDLCVLCVSWEEKRMESSGANLRSSIRGRATDRRRLSVLALVLKENGQAKVGNLEVPVAIQQDILRFEICRGGHRSQSTSREQAR